MGRKTPPERLAAIYEKVQENPGKKPGFIAKILGLDRSEVTRNLPAMEKVGYLLAEDDFGGLWPYKKLEKS